MAPGKSLQQSAAQMARPLLAGVGVLVTRSAHQSQAIIDAIEAQGGTVVHFPVIEILPRNAAAIVEDAYKLEAPDIAVFVSPNAVAHGLEHAESARIATVGPATAQAVAAAGRAVDLSPNKGFDSESLLNLAELFDVAGKRVRIIRGQDGRELLADTLRERGAEVDYLSVYERAMPLYRDDEVEALLTQWQNGQVNVVTVMSVASLENLLLLLPDSAKALLARTPLVTPAERVLKHLLERLPNAPATLADAPDADAMVRGIARAIDGLPGQA